MNAEIGPLVGLCRVLCSVDNGVGHWKFGGSGMGTTGCVGFRAIGSVQYSFRY